VNHRIMLDTDLIEFVCQKNEGAPIRQVTACPEQSGHNLPTPPRLVAL
jgi:hypothetical protein